MEAERNLHRFHQFLAANKMPSFGYGLALIVERGTAGGPAASASSARPMHSPLCRPAQGMPPIAGMSGLPGTLPNGEFGTNIGVQTVVYTSSSSPGMHAAIGGATVPAVGTATMEITGAATTAIANPPARSNRPAGNWKVAIVTLSIVLLTKSSANSCGPCRRSACVRTDSLLMSLPKSWRERLSAIATLRLPPEECRLSRPESGARAPFL